MRPIIRWDPMPEAVRQIIRPLLVQYLWLLPTWCHLLRVGYQTDEEGFESAQAVTSASVEYRHARIVFCGEWLTSNPTERRLTVIHELLHVPLATMTFEHNHQLDRLFEGSESPKFESTLRDHWRKAVEGTVQDLSYAILSLPDHLIPEIEFLEEESTPE